MITAEQLKIQQSIVKENTLDIYREVIEKSFDKIIKEIQLTRNTKTNYLTICDIIPKHMLKDISMASLLLVMKCIQDVVEINGYTYNSYEYCIYENNLTKYFYISW